MTRDIGRPDREQTKARDSRCASGCSRATGGMSMEVRIQSTGHPRLPWVEGERWRELVQDLISDQAERDAMQWKWGRLLEEEIEPTGRVGANTGALSRLQRFAHEAGVAVATLRIWRWTWNRWADVLPRTADRATWGAHRELN